MPRWILSISIVTMDGEISLYSAATTPVPDPVTLSVPAQAITCLPGFHLKRQHVI